MLAHCTDTSHECQCVCVRCLLLLLQWPTGEKPAGSRLPVKTSSSPRHNPPSTTTNAPPPPPTSSSSTSTGGIGSGQDENKVIDTSTAVVVTYTTTHPLTHTPTHPLTHSLTHSPTLSLLFPLQQEPQLAPSTTAPPSSSARSLDLSALRKRLD